ncbi:MAG: hypothetical protein V4594_14970 [Bacteroidota bacterium]
MKQHNLYLNIRITVDSSLPSLSETIQEFEQGTRYEFSATENVTVTNTEILRTEPFHSNNLQP